MLSFGIGAAYLRSDVKELAGLDRDAKGGPWDTGIVEHDGEFLIFANVGTEGRTGHDYGNRWEGEYLRWYHKQRSQIQWPSVQGLLTIGQAIHVFFRSSNRAPFVYAGLARPQQVLDSTPVEILWAFDSPTYEDMYSQVAQGDPGSLFREGMSSQVQANVYERNRNARQVCVDYYGPVCSVCGLNFEDRYGAIGAGYIHVHHLVPLSDIGKRYNVDPMKDLRPICPNCHAMVHQRSPPYSIEELRRYLIV